jgi:hypothetical protein
VLGGCLRGGGGAAVRLLVESTRVEELRVAFWRWALERTVAFLRCRQGTTTAAAAGLGSCYRGWVLQDRFGDGVGAATTTTTTPVRGEDGARRGRVGPRACHGCAR